MIPNPMKAFKAQIVLSTVKDETPLTMKAPKNRTKGDEKRTVSRTGKQNGQTCLPRKRTGPPMYILHVIRFPKKRSMRVLLYCSALSPEKA